MKSEQQPRRHSV